MSRFKLGWTPQDLTYHLWKNERRVKEFATCVLGPWKLSTMFMLHVRFLSPTVASLTLTHHGQEQREVTGEDYYDMSTVDDGDFESMGSTAGEDVGTFL